MKETLGKILRIFTTVLMVLSICTMIFTVISVLTFNRSDRQLFGYRAFIVLSDSMSATDFKAGDLVLTRDVDPATLQPGDIIAFTSTNDENYGQTVTHKIRSLTTTADGEPGFITYGTTTGTDDTAVVTYMDVLGKYAGRVLTYDFLMKELWGPCSKGDNKILRVNMANIRRKIEKTPAQPKYIFTEVGVGYRMAEGDEP
jgi:signal peptidase I